MLSEMIPRPLMEILNDTPFIDIEKWLFEKPELDLLIIKTIEKTYLIKRLTKSRVQIK